jgi:hypothetical protein
LGQIADELRRATVPVVDNLNRVGAVPDIIHGNHNTELITSLLHFESVPAVFYCHSWTDWISAPPAHPRILAYVAVDDTCRDRLVLEHAIPEERVHVQLHAADLERFKARERLPHKPARALVFSNNASHWTHLNAVREACKRAGIKLDVVGAGVQASATNPETLLGNYDLVFAKARCTLEALSAGTAVILCDAAGCGPLVTTADLERVRRLNFGIRTLTEKVDANTLLKQIERYDAADAMEVSRRIRATSDLESLVDDVITLYGSVIAEFRERPAIDPAEENRAVAEYLRWMTLVVRGKQAQFETMLVNSPTLRLRNHLGRVPLMNKVLRPMAQFARRKRENGSG